VFETRTKRGKLLDEKIKEGIGSLENSDKRLENGVSKELVLKGGGSLALGGGNEEDSFSGRGAFFNGKLMNNIDYNRLRNKIDSVDVRDKEVEKAPLESGLPIVYVDANSVKRFKEFEESFGFNEYRGRMGDEVEKHVSFVIEKIVEDGWMDLTQVQRLCGSEKAFKVFLDKFEESGIIFDGDDFRVNGK